MPPDDTPYSVRPPPTFLTQARRSSWPRDRRMYMYEFAPDQILWRSGDASGFSLVFLLTELKPWVMSLCIPRHQDVREKSVSVVFNIFQYLSFLAKMLYPSTNILVKVMIKRIIFCCSALSALYFSKLIVNQHGSLRHYYMRERERERRGSDS